MGLPVSFLAGMLVLLLHAQVDDSLPGEGSLGALLGCLVLALPTPWLVARTAGAWVAGFVQRGHLVPPPPLLALLRLQPLVVPACYAFLVFGGALPQVVARLVPGSSSLQLGILCAPLVLMEISMRLAERPMLRWLERLGISAPPLLGPERLGMILFVALPFGLLTAAADLLALHRESWVFFQLTGFGTTLGLLLLVLFLCVALPLGFRLLMPLSRDLPGHLAADVHRTAETLGFRSAAVLTMRTRYRVINAALIGPAPWPRFLVLTDGLLALLDRTSLRGVIAHEVGHARAQHPAILVLVFGGLPLLLMQPAMLFDTSTLDTVQATTAGIVLVLLLWLVLRGLAHRFEYEADQLSAEALGGPTACIQALRRVGELSPRGLHRSTFRHPSEGHRIRHLLDCEHDDRYRARFWRRGRLIRVALGAALVLAAAVSVRAHLQSWPLDRATYLFYCGRFEDAGAQLQTLPEDLPVVQREQAASLRREVQTALELGYGNGSWDDVTGELSGVAFASAMETLERDKDPELALPALSLALQSRHAEPWLQTLYLFCATSPDDVDERQRIRTHLFQLDTPEPIRRAVAALDQ